MRIKLLLILLLSTLIINGCGKDQYSIEREYWYLQKRAKKILLNPDASPPRQLNKVVNALNNFIIKYPKSPLEVSAEFSIAGLYIVKKEFLLARGQLQRILVKHKNSDNICSEALFLIGNTYQSDDKWGQALLKYKEVITRYPLTLRGLDLPLYIGQYYKLKYQPDKMMEAYREATVHYDGISQSNQDTALGYRIVLLTVEAKLAAKDTQGAINTFNYVISNYKDAETRASALMNIALLYAKTKDNSKAKETLQRLINNYPKSRLIKNARKFLGELEKK